MIKKLLAIIILIMTLSIAGAGCTSLPPLIKTSHVNAYANAFVNSTRDNSGLTLISSNIVQNGSDAVQVSMTLQNTTPTLIWSNGSIYTYTLNIKQFDNTNDASNFFNSTCFGYSPHAPVNSAIYEQVMGHTPTINRYSTQTASLSLFGASINIASQQDEFVIYGTGMVGPT